MTSNDNLDFGQTIRGFVEDQSVFGRYTLKHILGRGGMGVVWLARDDRLERDMALKFMPEMVRLDESAIDDLKRETRRSLELTHPHIVRIYDFVEDAKSAAIAMEFVNGCTLSALRIQKLNRVFEVDELYGTVEQITSALEYAHEHARIVHRDLKPTNLMVDDRSRIKITDFGIARSMSDSVSRISVLQPGATSGSPPFMSPQQVMGEPASVRDDIYSLGATLYELLTSKPPFYTGNIFRQIEEVTPPSLAERRQQLGIEQATPIPEAWERTIAACLAKNPADRPQSAAELMRELNPTMAPVQRPVEVITKESKKEKKPTPLSAWIGLAVVVMVALCVGGWAIWHSLEERQMWEVQALVKEADRLYDEGQWAEASARYKKLRSHPITNSKIAKIEEIQTAIEELESALKQGDLPTAKSALTRLQALDVPAPLLEGMETSISNFEGTQYLNRLLAESRKGLDQQDWEQARLMADMALGVDPSNADATALKKQAQSKLDEIEKNKPEIELLARQAQKALDWGSPEEARTLLLRALELDPRNSHANQMLEKVQAAENTSRTAPTPSASLSSADIQVTNTDEGPILTFPSGQRVQIPGSGKGILGPTSNPSLQAPLVSPDGKIISITSQPETQSAYAYLVLRASDGSFDPPVALNPKLAGFSLPGVAVKQGFLRVQRVEDGAVILQSADLTNVLSGDGEFALLVADGKPIFPDGKGYFTDDTVFSMSSYASFNTHSKRQILRSLQQRLKDRGYYTFPVDGTMGKGTQASIILFQHAKKLMPTGLLDMSTLSAIGLDGIEESQPLPPQAKKPSPPPSSKPSRSPSPKNADSYIRKQLGL